MFLMARKEGIKGINLPFQETRLDCKVVPGLLPDTSFIRSGTPGWRARTACAPTRPTSTRRRQAGAPGIALFPVPPIRFRRRHVPCGQTHAANTDQLRVFRRIRIRPRPLRSHMDMTASAGAPIDNSPRFDPNSKTATRRYSRDSRYCNHGYRQDRTA